MLVALSPCLLAAAGAGKLEQHKEEAPPEDARPGGKAAAGSHEAPAETEEEEAGDADRNPSAGPRSGILHNLSRTVGAAAGMLSETPKAVAHAGGAANAVVARADAATSHVAGGLRGMAAGVSERAGELGSSVQVCAFFYVHMLLIEKA